MAKQKAKGFKDVDFQRHKSIFDPDKYGKTRIDIIGAGATGSKVALELANLGCENLHVWDFDEVEAHNIPNQAYGPKHIGKTKCEALKKVVKENTGVKITTHEKAFTGKEGEDDVGEVIFVLTDTMKSRKEIWNNLKDRIEPRLVIETRMGVEQARLYVIEPSDDAKSYEETLYDDDTAEQSACGSRVTVGMTATILAGLAVWAMIEWRSGEKPPNESIFCVKGSKMFVERKFDKKDTKAEEELLLM